MAPPAHALFGLPKFPFFEPRKTSQRQARAALPGQKVRVFKLQKAQAADLVDLLDRYLQGIHSQGSILCDASANTLIVTEEADGMRRMETVIQAMDRAYDNPNARARQMLASQHLLKVIRTLPPSAAKQASFAPPETSPGAAVPASQLEDDAKPGLRRVMEERPDLPAFRMIGWARDGKGLIVVLRNEGQRYIFRGGRVLYGGLGNKEGVPGLTGVVQGERLILRDEHQRVVSLSLRPRPGRNGETR